MFTHVPLLPRFRQNINGASHASVHASQAVLALVHFENCSRTGTQTLDFFSIHSVQPALRPATKHYLCEAQTLDIFLIHSVQPASRPATKHHLCDLFSRNWWQCCQRAPLYSSSCSCGHIMYSVDQHIAHCLLTTGCKMKRGNANWLTAVLGDLSTALASWASCTSN